MDTPETEFEQLSRPGEGALRLIVGLHWVESAAQVFGLLVLRYASGLALPYGSLSVVIAVFVAWNFWSAWLVRRGVVYPERQVAVQLMAEVLVLAGLLYFTGGATNPFVSLFLVPLAIGAMTIRFSIALAIAMACIAFYTFLLFYYEPLAAQHMGHNQGFGLHVIGMWVNFLVSAAVCLVALSWLSSLARARAENIASLREEMMRSAQVSALGGMAAAAAHSLSTPLSTVAVVLDDLRDSLDPGDARVGRLALASEQLAISRERLTEVLRSAQAERVEVASSMSVSSFLERVVMQWRLQRPDMQVVLKIDSGAAIRVDPTIEYTLTTLLDNAGDANAEHGMNEIVVSAHDADDVVAISVEDAGGGPVPDPGAPSNKPHGAGAGLLIATANVKRIGGSLAFEMGERGCIALVSLPVISAGRVA